MSKSDAAMKKQLDSIGDHGKLKRRRFIGGSKQDQQLWKDGGLTFGINGVSYGSCDFAWYVEKKWKDPFDKKETEQRPVLVVEATDCLNTRSYGSAQIQRFHHGLGSFLCGINSVYYLNKGPEAERLRPYLPGAAYFATQYHRSKGLKAAYLVTTDINDIECLVVLLAQYGENSKQFQQKIDEILGKMLAHFNKVFQSKRYKGNWEKYLESRDIIKCLDGKWVKDIGARKKSFTVGSQRYGHITIGEAMTSTYLLIASRLLNPSANIFYYLFPLMKSKELSDLDEDKKIDKEWHLLRSTNSWKVITLDELEGVPRPITDLINSTYRSANLNKVKGWEELKKKIRKGMKNGLIKIK